jgi:beta-glucosidase
MKNFIVITLTAFLVSGCCAINRCKIKEAKGYNLATTPTSEMYATNWRKFWGPRYQEKVKFTYENANKIDIVFVGDSITHFWDTTGKEVAAEKFPNHTILNLGFSGDRTQQTIWTTSQKEIWGKINPKLITLMIGTNNIGWNESDATATLEGIKIILSNLRKNAPEAKILLFAIFPRGKDKTDQFRPQIDIVNAALQNLADGENIIFVNINNKLMNADGTISKEMMPDYLHPAKPGYVIWADAIKPYINW